MYVQLNCVIVDADPANRQELANFMAGFGVNVLAQAPAADGLPGLLGRADAPRSSMPISSWRRCTSASRSSSRSR
jgi:hypothetical protein